MTIWRGGVREHSPRKLDKLYDYNRLHANKQPNGYITRVNTADGEVFEVEVTFYASKDGTVDEYVKYSFSDLEGYYTNEIRGYVINE